MQKGEGFGEECRRYDYGQQSVVQRIVLEYIRKEAAYYGLESISGNSPCSMLATASASEIFARYEDNTVVTPLIENKVGIRRSVFGVSPVVKQKISETVSRCGFEEASGDDLVGINVLQGEGNACGCYCLESFFHITEYYFVIIYNCV